MKRLFTTSLGWIAIAWLAGMLMALNGPSFAGQSASGQPADGVQLAVAQDPAGAAAPAAEKPADPATPAGTVKKGKGARAASADKKGGKKSGDKKSDKPSGRLPAYYNKVVSPEQRDKIYAIQAEYSPKIDPLKRQIAELTKEQDAKIAAVLTPEQLKKIEDLKAEAQAARDAKKKDKAKPGAKE